MIPILHINSSRLAYARGGGDGYLGTTATGHGNILRRPRMALYVFSTVLFYMCFQIDVVLLVLKFPATRYIDLL